MTKQVKNKSLVTPITRRSCLGGLVALSAALGLGGGLSACGWRIRGKIELPYKKILISGTMTPELKNMIVMVLNVNEIQVVEAAKESDLVLEIMSEQNAKQVLSYNASGQITAYRIISRVAFKVFNISGVEIFPESDIFLTRDLDFNPANIQSFDYMVNEVVKNMRADIVVQMLRRMSSIKTIEKPTNVNAQGYSRTIKPSPSSPAPNNSNTAK